MGWFIPSAVIGLIERLHPINVYKNNEMGLLLDYVITKQKKYHENTIYNTFPAIRTNKSATDVVLRSKTYYLESSIQNDINEINLIFSIMCLFSNKDNGYNKPIEYDVKNIHRLEFNGFLKNNLSHTKSGGSVLKKESHRNDTLNKYSAAWRFADYDDGMFVINKSEIESLSSLTDVEKAYSRMRDAFKNKSLNF